MESTMILDDKSFLQRRKVNLKDFEFVNQSFESLAKLGSGAHATVRLVRYLSKSGSEKSGKLYAMKIISKEKIHRYDLQ